AQSRRWTKVSFRFTSRKQRISGQSSTAPSARKISEPRLWPHQLPRMGPPATASATLGTGPFADARTTPCCATKATGSNARAIPNILRGAHGRVEAYLDLGGYHEGLGMPGVAHALLRPPLAHQPALERGHGRPGVVAPVRAVPPRRRVPLPRTPLR